jgi:hypothetical protein
MNRKIIFLFTLALTIVFSSCLKQKEAPQTLAYKNDEDDFEIGVLRDGVSAVIIRYKGVSRTVNIPATIQGKTITIIGSYAFRNYVGITGINIPDSVTEIERAAFIGCSTLTGIIIPDSVTVIRDYAFYECTSLTEITIPKSVIGIGEDVFTKCNNLTAINVAADNSAFSSEDGVLYNKNKTVLYTYPSGKKGAFTIPKSVKNILKNTFSYCLRLESINIHDSLTKIHESAFNDCVNLAEIKVDTKNKVFSSNDGILYNKSQDILLRCPEGKTGAFIIPNHVTDIGNNAFYKCVSFYSITIPNSVTVIGEGAFSGCSGLKNITIPNSITYIAKYTFQYCTGFFEITIPDSVTVIGESAFFRCENIEKITIPDSVIEIGFGAFSECRNLTGIIIPDSVTAIGSFAFHGCGNLKKIIIPNSITVIEERTFCDCGGLTDVTIPEDVAVIGESAFSNCIELKSIIIPNSVVRIDSQAFFYTGLTKVVFKGMIDRDDFSDSEPFPGDLREKYFKNGIGTYTAKNSGEVWEYKGRL